MSRTSDPQELAAGRLRPCPRSPNCVSSQAEDPSHRVEPLRFQGDPEAAMDRLRRALVSLPGAVIATRSGHYLHAEFTTSIFRFVDDVEALLDPKQGVVHLRSASRLGYSDLGANRRRVEAIRAAFQDA